MGEAFSHHLPLTLPVGIHTTREATQGRQDYPLSSGGALSNAPEVAWDAK